jgi:hypothetical protein
MMVLPFNAMSAPGQPTEFSDVRKKVLRAVIPPLSYRVRKEPGAVVAPLQGQTSNGEVGGAYCHGANRPGPPFRQ